ncbi:MAG: ribosome maturation factor RimM [Lachnospiraceae bacterium]
MEPLLQIGVISSTHGVKGEVKVFPTTDDVTRFKKLKQVILDTGKEQFAIVKFKGIDDINEIEKYKGRPLLVERKDAVKLQEDEYFIADMIGMKVITEDMEAFGTLVDVLETGANDVYVIETKDKKEVLIPAIKQCVLQVSMETMEMKIRLLDGLL